MAFFDLLHNILEKLGYLQKIRIAFFPSELCRKLWTQKILPRHVDCRKCCQHNLDTQCDKQAIVVGRTKMSIYLQRSTHTRRAGPSAQLISVFSLPLNPFYPPASRSSTRLLSTASSLYPPISKPAHILPHSSSKHRLLLGPIARVEQFTCGTAFK